ncbi:MAG: hypothetical protein ACYSUR_14445, partial [Planctomycetota bacterium]
TSAAAAMALAAAATVTAQDPRINEIRIEQSGTDNDEYFELAGTPDAPLTGLSYIVIGDDAVGGSGVVEEWIILSPYSIGPTGYFVAAENTFTLGVPNLYTTLNFENNDNVTHMLVLNFTGQVGDDLDFPVDDGVLDLTPWDAIIDCVGVVGAGTPGVDADYVYCGNQVGPNGLYVPGQVYRCEPDLTWTVGDFNLGFTDTPGAVNTSCDYIPPCGSGLAGSCFEANGTPNCSDETCCISVCGLLPTCCSVAWDQFCADLAQIECRQCGDADTGSCFEPNGTAYCDITECCTIVCAIDPTCCQINGWVQACADLALTNCEVTVQPGDVVIGLSDPVPNLSMALARGEPVLNGGTLAIEGWIQPYIQSVELDNLDGISHNPQGNLLGVNFGASSTVGGEIYNLPTCQAVGPGVLIGDTLGLGGVGLTPSRLGGLSISPGNTKIAVVGYDTGKVIVYDYVAGNCQGAGAVLSGARETATAPMCLQDTQGTAWLDDDTVLAFASQGTIVAVDATAMTTTDLVTGLPSTCGPAVTDIEYNPEISPYVFAIDGEFSGGTTNTMWVLDPDNSWAMVNQVDYSLSINTTREIALGPGGDLFVPTTTRWTGPTRRARLTSARTPGSTWGSASPESPAPGTASPPRTARWTSPTSWPCWPSGVRWGRRAISTSLPTASASPTSWRSSRTGARVRKSAPTGTL